MIFPFENFQLYAEKLHLYASGFVYGNSPRCCIATIRYIGRIDGYFGISAHHYWRRRTRAQTVSGAPADNSL